MRHNNEELASSWGNLVNRVANLINKNFGEIPPLDEDSMTNEDRGLLEESSAAFDVVGSSIETHHQKHALSEAMRVVGDINKYISATEPWKIKDDQARLGTVLHVAAQAVSDANHLLAPFLPHSAQKVWEALGGTGTFSPLPELKEVEDLDKPGFTYPIITGDYELGVNVHPWKSEAIEVGAWCLSPHRSSPRFRPRPWKRSWLASMKRWLLAVPPKPNVWPPRRPSSPPSDSALLARS